MFPTSTSTDAAASVALLALSDMRNLMMARRMADAYTKRPVVRTMYVKARLLSSPPGASCLCMCSAYWISAVGLSIVWVVGGRPVLVGRILKEGSAVLLARPPGETISLAKPGGGGNVWEGNCGGGWGV